MAITYEPISTQTLASAVGTVTFSSIPATYTDLRFVINPVLSAIASARIRFNGDTASNYSFTGMSGDGTSATSYRLSSQNRGYYTYNAIPSTSFDGNALIDVFNYTNTTTAKTYISRANSLSGYSAAEAIVGLWRATPAAITSVAFSLDSGNYNIGSTFTLYGIKAA
jgi:hypothetical protein